MILDPIADFLSRIRNAQQRKKEIVSIPHSNMIESIATILKEEDFIEDFKVVEAEPRNQVEISLRYVDGTPAIRSLKRISKPGIRKYRGYREIPTVKSGMGVAIFSTPRGVVTGEIAKKEKIGGEYICEIY